MKKKTNRFKQPLSLILALVMIIGIMMPSTVSAYEYPANSSAVTTNNFITLGESLYTNLVFDAGKNETEMTISWQSDNSVTSAHLGYMKRGDANTYKIIIAETVDLDAAGNPSQIYKTHWVELFDLEASTTYDFVIIQGTAVSADTSEILSFTTAAANLFTPFDISAYSLSDYYNLLLTPGKNATEMGVSWHTATSVTSASIGIKKSGDTGAYTVISAASRNSNTTSGFTFTYKIHQLTLTGLEPSTTYEYVIITDGTESDSLSFKTVNPSNFSFFATGDIQIGADGSVNNRGWQTENWDAALSVMTTNFPDASFIASAGDQVESNGTSSTSMNNSQNEYNLFTTPSKLSSLPMAPSVGNHDVSPLMPDHYSISNDTKYQHNSGPSQFDYWYRYGNMLVIVLDSNTSTMTAARRTNFENIIAANTDATWRVVMFHHAPYSVYRAETDGTKVNIRNNWIPVFDAQGIDVVINGHCHSYARSYQMIGNEAAKNQWWLDGNDKVVNDPTGKLYNKVLNPTGIVYISLSTTTGAKFYTPLTERDSSAFFDGTGDGTTKQNKELPNFSVVNVTATTFTVSTYQVNGTAGTAGTVNSTPNNSARISANDSITMIDTYTIVKDDSIDSGNRPERPMTRTVNFNSNGGSAVDRIELNDGTTVTKPSDPTRDGFAFAGWFLNNTAYNFSTPVTASITLMAKWEEIVPEGTYKLSSFGDDYWYLGRTNAEFLTDSFDMTKLSGWIKASSAIGYGTGNGRKLDSNLDSLTLMTNIISTDPDPKNTFTYFKKEFTLPANFNVNTIKNVLGEHRIDDNLIIYINGIEVYRYNTSNTPADVEIGKAINWGAYVGYNSDATTRGFNIDSDYSARDTGFQSTSSGNPNLRDAASFSNLKTALKPGVNMITCVVGNNSSSSSDLWFDLDLRIVTGEAPGYDIEVGNAIVGGIGYKRSVTVKTDNISGTAGMYLLSKVTETDSGITTVAYSVVALKGNDELFVTYTRAGAEIEIWLLSGSPDMVGTNQGKIMGYRKVNS